MLSLVFASLGIGPELGIIGLGLSKSKPDRVVIQVLHKLFKSTE